MDVTGVLCGDACNTSRNDSRRGRTTLSATDGVLGASLVLELMGVRIPGAGVGVAGVEAVLHRGAWTRTLFGVLLYTGLVAGVCGDWGVRCDRMGEVGVAGVCGECTERRALLGSPFCMCACSGLLARVVLIVRGKTRGLAPGVGAEKAGYGDVLLLA